MHQCQLPNCSKTRKNVISKRPYCPMHLERFRRHSYFETKRERGEHALEKIPHDLDAYILEHSRTKFDEEIAADLQILGYASINADNVKYRRRKLGVKKYEYGEVKKHKAWIRAQALKRYGDACELCTYSLAVETHHVVPRHQGGAHEVENLMVMCPNCHALVTRRMITIGSRSDIPELKLEIRGKLRALYGRL